MKKFIATILVGVFTLSLIAVPVATLAQNQNFLENVADSANIDTSRELPEIIGGFINVLLSILGIVAVVLVLWGGFLWMTAAGNPDQVDKAKKLLYSGIIGLVIIFAAFAIARFILDQIQTAVTGS